MARRFSAPVVKSIFTPDTWDLHQASVESGTVDKLMPSASPDSPVPFSTGVTADELGRTESRLRRITPGTIREGSRGLTASPFPEHRIAPKKLKDPLAYMHIPMPGGAPTASGMSMPGSVSVPGSAPTSGSSALARLGSKLASTYVARPSISYAERHSRFDPTLGRRVPLMTLAETDAERKWRASLGYYPDVSSSLKYDYEGDTSFPGMSVMEIYEATKDAHARAYRKTFADYL